MYLREFKTESGETLALGFNEAPTIVSGNIVNDDFALSKIDDVVSAKIGDIVIDGEETPIVDPVVTVSIANWEEGQTASNPIVTYNGETYTGSKTVEYKLQSAAEWTTTVPTAAGEYDIKVTVPAQGDYAEGTATNTFEITAVQQEQLQEPGE